MKHWHELPPTLCRSGHGASRRLNWVKLGARRVTYLALAVTGTAPIHCLHVVRRETARLTVTGRGVRPESRLRIVTGRKGVAICQAPTQTAAR